MPPSVRGARGKVGETDARPLVPLSFLVVDQNYLRNADLRSFRSSGVPLALPQTALGEILKAHRWRRIAEQSLRILSESPGSVAMLHRPRDLLERELETGLPAQDFFDRPGTQVIRDLLWRLAKGEPEALDSLQDGRLQIRAGCSPFYDGDAVLHRFAKAQTTIRELMSDAELKLLRQGDLGPFVTALVGAAGDTILTNVLRRSTESDAASNLTTTHSFFASHVLTTYVRQADWIATGGAEGLDPNHASRDRLDDQYITPAVHGHGLLTVDKRASRRHKLVLQIVRRRAARFGQPFPDQVCP